MIYNDNNIGIDSLSWAEKHFVGILLPPPRYLSVFYTSSFNLFEEKKVENNKRVAGAIIGLQMAI